MQELCDFWIERIYVIVKKKEAPGFWFENPRRAWDGFVLITEGEGVFRCEQVEMPIKSGDIVLLGKGCHYSTSLENGGSYITTAFDIGFDDSKAEKSFPCVMHCNQKQIAEIEYICRLWTENRYANAMECRIRLMGVYSGIFESISDNVPQRIDPDIAAAISFIKGNFKRNFSSEEIAKCCNLSKSHLRNKFSKAVGMSMTDYREALRIAEAQNMLKSGFFSVKEVAGELGYFDVFHFTKKFSKALGVSPAAYKKSFHTKQ